MPTAPLKLSFDLTQCILASTLEASSLAVFLLLCVVFFHSPPHCTVCNGALPFFLQWFLFFKIPNLIPVYPSPRSLSLTPPIISLPLLLLYLLFLASVFNGL